jgi:hypothetical protein
MLKDGRIVITHAYGQHVIDLTTKKFKPLVLTAMPGFVAPRVAGQVFLSDEAGSALANESLVSLPDGRVLVAGLHTLILDPIHGTTVSLGEGWGKPTLVPRDCSIWTPLADGKMLVTGGGLGYHDQLTTTCNMSGVSNVAEIFDISSGETKTAFVLFAKSIRALVVFLRFESAPSTWAKSQICAKLCGSIVKTALSIPRMDCLTESTCGGQRVRSPS